MMNKLPLNKTILYILAIFILFIIPVYTVISNSDTLKDGTSYLFKVQGFDPYDMFRGNYLNIRFKENRVRQNNNSNEETDDEKIANKECYVTIGKDDDGFAYFKSISNTKPSNTSDYFKTTINWNNVIDTPTRYYMNENKSMKAEEIYSDNIDNTYVKVRVKNGKMVIVGAYVNDVLIDSID